jgi:hypothetical protein
LSRPRMSSGPNSPQLAPAGRIFHRCGIEFSLCLIARSLDS